MHTTDVNILVQRANAVRAQIIRMSNRSGLPHVGSALSCVDILIAAYFDVLKNSPETHNDPDRDRFIFSKGHACAALYATLALRGYFPTDDLLNYGKHGSLLTEHPSRGAVPGIEVSTGSLGHGLSLGAGFALSARLEKRAYRTFVLMSDGECNEGSVWEAALFAGAQRLSNLVAIVDFNKWQATGRSAEVMALQPFADKWRSFGWSAYQVDGHNISDLLNLLRDMPDGSTKPVAIIAHTIKGKGISFMEDDNNWHYRIPTAEEVRQAEDELGVAR